MGGGEGRTVTEANVEASRPRSLSRSSIDRPSIFPCDSPPLSQSQSIPPTTPTTIVKPHCHTHSDTCDDNHISLSPHIPFTSQLIPHPSSLPLLPFRFDASLRWGRSSSRAAGRLSRAPTSSSQSSKPRSSHPRAIPLSPPHPPRRERPGMTPSSVPTSLPSTPHI